MGTSMEVRARITSAGLWVAFSCLASWVLLGCVTADTDSLEQRQCRADADCPTSGHRCEAGYCQGPLGICDSDVDCEDGLFCNGTSVCDPGSSLADEDGCVMGASPALNDGIRCTVDLCDESSRSVLHTRSQDCVCEDETDHAACEALVQARGQTCESARCNLELTCTLVGCE